VPDSVTRRRRGSYSARLGELAWYLSGSNRADFVTHYIKRYQDDTEADGTIYGAYGPRMFRPDGASQFDNVMSLLRERPTSRRAVIQLFDGDDLRGDYKDVPCTCTLQLFVRQIGFTWRLPCDPTTPSSGCLTTFSPSR